MDGNRRAHWDQVYTAKNETEVSWFQPAPHPSRDLLALVAARPESAIIDVGGGASRLVDSLLADGFVSLTVLDLSAEALDVAQRRLGARAAAVRWIAADATSWEPEQRYDVWHDRAAFHFLTDAGDQLAYLARLRRGLQPGGAAIFGTFALDGPEKCSGLPVMRHSAASLAALLGDDFELLDSRRHLHRTPWDSGQQFQFSTFVRRGT